MEKLCAKTCSGDLRFAAAVNLSSPKSQYTECGLTLCRGLVTLVNSLHTRLSYLVRRTLATAVYSE